MNTLILFFFSQSYQVIDVCFLFCFFVISDKQDFFLLQYASFSFSQTVFGLINLQMTSRVGDLEQQWWPVMHA